MIILVLYDIHEQFENLNAYNHSNKLKL